MLTVSQESRKGVPGGEKLGHGVTLATCQMSTVDSKQFKNLEKRQVVRIGGMGWACLMVRGDCRLSLGTMR